MKCSLALLSVLGLAVAQDMAQISQALVAMGFPSCAVPCVLAGNKAAAEKAGCALMDQACQCTTGYKAAQDGVMGCMMQTKPCPEADMAKVGTAGANLCASSKQAAPPGSSNGTASAGTASSGTASSGSASSGSKPSGTVPSAAATTSGPAGGAHAAAGPSSSHNAAMPQRTFAAGAMGLVGAVVAMAL